MPEPRHIVVVDDVCRFALHVWQFFSRKIAFGIGDVSNENGRRIFGDTAPRSLPTAAHHTEVWWVDASKTQTAVEADLRQILRQVNSSRCDFLLDVRGPRRPRDVDSYELARVLELLDMKGHHPGEHGETGAARNSRIHLVSAYSRGAFPFRRLDLVKVLMPIRSKSSATLQVLWEAPPDTGKSSEVFHFLITGAGFERSDSRLGKALGHSEKTLGIPATERLLGETLQALRTRADSSHRFEPHPAKSSFGFPIPKFYAEGEEGAHLGVDLREAAEKPHLDDYWNELLELELRYWMELLAGVQPTEAKLKASNWELDLREAFRRVFLRYDWGYLNQALDAATLDWSAWLTTNYTRFADRAISLAERETGREDPSSTPWRTVSTSNEAARLLRELLHGQVTEPDYRFLFKLHGDIAHLTTMAIAGYDKEIFSPLSLPIDSLHQIYVAAEMYIKAIIQKAREKPVVWHIVGHGLQDYLLVKTLKRIYDDTRDKTDHYFMILDPYPDAKNPIPMRLRRQIKREDKKNVRSIALTAEEYLACLRRNSHLETWTDPKSWVENLPVDKAKARR